MLKSARLQLIFTMMLFGTIGTLSRFINMPSSILCLVRAAIGALILLFYVKISNNPLDKDAIKRNVGWLLLSSSCMCVNWVCQFEAFKYTTVATGTLCYYMQPIFFIIMSAVILKEKVPAKKWLCVLIAFAGMILVSGVLQVGFNLSELKGALYGVAGGFFYACVVLINKYMKNIGTVETTVMQLIFVSVIMIPYCGFTGSFEEMTLTSLGIACILILGVLHTGVAYVFYFDSVNRLPAQTVGILSYIDPVEACLLSAFFLKEDLTIFVLIGAVLILGATAVSEFGGKKEA